MTDQAAPIPETPAPTVNARSAAEEIMTQWLAKETWAESYRGIVVNDVAAIIAKHFATPAQPAPAEIEAEIDRIMALSDEDVLAETIAAGLDPSKIAAEHREMLAKVIATSRILDAAASEHAKARSNSEFQRGLMHDAFLAGAERQRSLAWQAAQGERAGLTYRIEELESAAALAGKMAIEQAADLCERLAVQCDGETYNKLREAEEEVRSLSKPIDRNALIERGARALYDNARPKFFRKEDARRPWEQLPDMAREHWKAEARAILSAWIGEETK